MKVVTGFGGFKSVRLNLKAVLSIPGTKNPFRPNLSRRSAQIKCTQIAQIEACYEHS